MSVAVSQHKNYVGGEWVDAVEGGTMEIVNPATGETIAEVPTSTAGGCRPRRRGRQERIPRVARHHAGRAGGHAPQLADALEANADELCRTESANVGKPIGPVVDEARGRRGQPPLLRRRRPQPRGPAAGEYMRGTPR